MRISIKHEVCREYSVKSIGINADEFINWQLEKKNINEVVHYIWYCVESDRFQKNENELVQNLMNTLNFSLDSNMDYSGKSIKLKIDAQAVQSENQAGTSLDALGWPEE